MRILLKTALLTGSLCIIFSLSAVAQYENIWVFGTRTGLNFNGAGPVSLTTAINSSEASASVCDRNGQLLFYTDGVSVWNRNHKLMPNGIGLTATGNSTLSTSQGAVIIPVTGQEEQYYIFSLSDNIGGGYLSYSMVDMQLDNGLGDVNTFVRTIPLDAHLTEHMVAITGDRCNTWLLVVSIEDTALLWQDGLMELKAYNIDYTGVSTVPVVSRIKAVSHTTFVRKWIGCIAASPDNSKIVVAGGGLWLYDFDQGTGMAANPQELAPIPRHPTEAPFFDSGYFYSPCFSADSRMLYGSTSRRIFQFDLNAGSYNDILDSRYTACDTTELIAYGAGLKRGPDNRIYAAHYSFPSLSVINAPEVPGPACGFVKDAVALSGNSGLGLPNAVIPLNRDTIYHAARIDTVPCFETSHYLALDSLAVNVIWDDGSTSRVREVNRTGVYYVFYSIPPCLSQRQVDTFRVLHKSYKPQIGISPACKADTNGSAWIIPIAGDTNQYVYTWMDTDQVVYAVNDTVLGLPSGKYLLYVVSSSGCVDTFELLIPEENYEVSFVSDTVICEGGTLQFNNTSDAHYTSFQWDFDDGESASLFSPSHVFDSAGSYRIQLMGAGAVCSDTFYRDIIVDPLLAAGFTLSRDSICVGESVEMMPGPLMESSLAGLHWAFGDGTEAEAVYNDPVHHTFNRSGTFPVILTARFRACPTSVFSDTVYVFDLPGVYLSKEYIGPDSGICLNGVSVVLENSSGGHLAGRHYRWSTGATTATITVGSPGRYSLTIVADPIGCSAADSVEIFKDCYPDIPNAFVPNGDGVNDYFFPKYWQGRDVKAFSMKIFNRWGQVIFETDNVYHKGWDGRFNNIPQSAGVYIYLINVVLKDSKAEQFTGNVTLLR